MAARYAMRYWVLTDFLQFPRHQRTGQSRLNAPYPPSAKLETSKLGRGSVACPVCSGDTYRVSGSRLSIQGLALLLLLLTYTNTGDTTHQEPETQKIITTKNIATVKEYTQNILTCLAETINPVTRATDVPLFRARHYRGVKGEKEEKEGGLLFYPSDFALAAVLTTANVSSQDYSENIRAQSLPLLPLEPETVFFFIDSVCRMSIILISKLLCARIKILVVCQMGSSGLSKVRVSVLHIMCNHTSP